MYKRNRIIPCWIYSVEAAIADYLLSWAHRLHSRAYETADAGNNRAALWHFFVGMMCARAAMAEIAEIARTLVHELAHHLTGRSGHCLAVSGIANTPQHDQPLYMCQYLLAFLFYSRIRAELGLPVASLYDGRFMRPFQPEPDEHIDHLQHGFRYLSYVGGWDFQEDIYGETPVVSIDAWARSQHCDVFAKKRFLRVCLGTVGYCTDSPEGGQWFVDIIYNTQHAREYCLQSNAMRFPCEM